MMKYLLKHNLIDGSCLTVTGELFTSLSSRCRIYMCWPRAFKTAAISIITCQQARQSSTVASQLLC